MRWLRWVLSYLVEAFKPPLTEWPARVSGPREVERNLVVHSVHVRRLKGGHTSLE